VYLAPKRTALNGFACATEAYQYWHVHPTISYVLSSSDDMVINLCDGDKGQTCNQIFKCHSHYAMLQVSKTPSRVMPWGR